MISLVGIVVAHFGKARTVLSRPDAPGRRVPFGKFHVENQSLGQLWEEIYGFDSSIKDSQQKAFRFVSGCDYFLRRMSMAISLIRSHGKISSISTQVESWKDCIHTGERRICS